MGNQNAFFFFQKWHFNLEQFPFYFPIIIIIKESLVIVIIFDFELTTLLGVTFSPDYEYGI